MAKASSEKTSRVKGKARKRSHLRPPDTEERRDGFNLEKRGLFLAKIAEGKSISTACALIGIVDSTFYEWKTAGAAWHGKEVHSRKKPTKTHGDFYLAFKAAEAEASERYLELAEAHAKADPRTAVEMLKVFDDRFSGNRAAARIRRLNEEKARQELKLLRAKVKVAEAVEKGGGSAVFLGVAALLEMPCFSEAFKAELSEAMVSGKIIAAAARDLAGEPAIGEGA